MTESSSVCMLFPKVVLLLYIPSSCVYSSCTTFSANLTMICHLHSAILEVYMAPLGSSGLCFPHTTEVKRNTFYQDPTSIDLKYWADGACLAQWTAKAVEQLDTMISSVEDADHGLVVTTSDLLKCFLQQHLNRCTTHWAPVIVSYNNIFLLLLEKRNDLSNWKSFIYQY